MERFARWMRCVLPNGWVLFVFAVLIGAGRLYIEYLRPSFHAGERFDQVACQYLFNDGLKVTTMAWCMLCFGYGIYRDLRNNPACDGEYFAWLRNSPWRWPLALPRGPALPVW